ncbi:MAG: hypothetical protein LUG66_06120 [Clostridiales bacterium]|nr:hypothetical protein [Clostridiales bacterium]
MMDKIKSRSKRKWLKAEIDASIKKASSYEEFIEDMKRKNFEIKQGMHLAFKDLDLAADDGKQQRFLRAKSLGSHYTEDAIKFRISHKEQYKEMTDNKINKVITVSYSEDINLISWKRGKNGQLTTDSRNWIVDNLFGDYGYDCRDFYNGKLDLANIEIYGLFLEKYESRTVSMASMENKIEDNEKIMHDIQKHIKAINSYWKLKPQLEKFRNVDPDSLSGQELTEYRSFRSKWQYAYKMFENSREKYGTLSTKKLKSRQDELKAEKEQLQEKLIELEFSSETWDNIKYNYESKDGWDYTPDKAELAKRLWASRKAKDEIKQQKEAEKAKLKEVQAKDIKRHIRDWTL